jgi:3-dehydroquinate synthase
LLGEAVRRVAVIHPPALAHAARRLAEGLAGLQVVTFETPDAEDAKTAAVAAECWALLGREDFTRSDAVIGLGGGATTDLAGFVAATWLRGVRVVQIPTTLLGMVDAAIGGKTGINTAQGKNLVGAFHAPAGVLCDLNTLTSLPSADYASGLAEVVKCGFVADPAILDLVEADPAGALHPEGPVTRELVERAVRVKAEVVSLDLREGSGSTGGPLGRETLNYGHTFGHAVEKVEGFRWRHGEAVSVGLVYVAELARLAGRIDDSLARRHADVLAALGLPVTYSSGRWPELQAAMRVDKKARGDRLRFVVLDGLGRPGLLEGPPEDLLTAAYAAISGRA